MFDFVLNHISAKSSWFHSYLTQQPGFKDLAIEVAPGIDLSMVVRPRSLPLLTPYTKITGEKVHLWTTFSADQIDLNYPSIDVLLKMIEVFLFYVGKGARCLRLDAVAYLWKKIGTSCIHLPQTHKIIQLLRSILDQIAPEVLIITETNVPHSENISYFGNGWDEAQMVYNFTLPPLLLHAFLNEDSTYFTHWADSLSTPSPRTAFFNFTASHDGIGLTPLKGILSAAQIERLVKIVRQNGGLVSSRRNSDGSESAYELNITYLDALKNGFDQSSQADRFLASQAIQMVLPGVPGIYIHSLLGSHNWEAGVRESGRARTINRERLQVQKVTAELDDPNSSRSNIFHRYCRMLQIRRSQPAFDPGAGFRMLPLHKQVIAIERSNGKQHIHALTNICGRTVKLASTSVPLPSRDLLTSRIIPAGELALMPFQSLWLAQP
jgi:sucrose phosphorylase